MYHVVMSTGRDELQTLSFAFKAYGSNKTDRPQSKNIDMSTKQCVHARSFAWFAYFFLPVGAQGNGQKQ